MTGGGQYDLTKNANTQKCTAVQLHLKVIINGQPSCQVTLVIQYKRLDTITYRGTNESIFDIQGIGILWKIVFHQGRIQRALWGGGCIFYCLYFKGSKIVGGFWWINIQAPHLSDILYMPLFPSIHPSIPANYSIQWTQLKILQPSPPHPPPPPPHTKTIEITKEKRMAN